MEPLLLSAVLLVLAALVLLLAAVKSAASQRSLAVRMGGGVRHGGRYSSHRPVSNRTLSRWQEAIDPEVPKLLDQLGWRKASRRGVYFTCQLGIPVVALAVVLALAVVGALSSGNLILGLCVAGGGYLIPNRLLVRAVARRKERLSEEVAVMVPMLRMLFEVGMTVEQTLRALIEEGREVLPELAQELQTVITRVDAGLELGQELRDMAAVLDVDELTDCTTILEQLINQGGGALASLLALKTLLDDRRLTTMQEKVSKLSAKMSAVMVAFLFPALLIILAGPGFIARFGALKGLGQGGCWRRDCCT